ncbi:helix-turn-helix domain-containing protein [Pedobacter alluvionis]|uniref:AraC-like DNA-binding protein n=1 Tax=Pedobacter alluvionis TaxID=475253 RepID=A0A497Y8L4_9SPHI|nr:helix-turn-helix domain-containing protein [Pedobacter alluvionis]RLJ77308.1 AraC-like DNA-binding protein [Pedobacter alluvionis]TFB33469.1 helix-turn-helix domain-containing protein [Pedobacter alluvionis]
MKQSIFDENLKTIGMLNVDLQSIEVINSEAYKSYIKVLYLNEGFEIKVDFNIYNTSGPTLFFISPNQVLSIEKLGEQPGRLVFYNRDFYCIQLHDEEVACDGLLFNNINNMPMTVIPEQDATFIEYLFSRMEDEFELKDGSLEEMIRTYLKQLLIKSTRLWKVQHLEGVMAASPNNDLEFFRKFTQLVEALYKQKHNVADYADLLLIAPKTLTHRFKRLGLPQPNEIIKNRIILEAKRLLVHTDKSAKEIAYSLGYDDPAYFSRLFLIKTGEPPSGFRSKYLSVQETKQE